MDALSDVLRVVRLVGGVFLDAEFTSPWCITAQVEPEDCKPLLASPAQLIAYHYVVSGELLVQAGDEPPVLLHSGRSCCSRATTRTAWAARSSSRRSRPSA